MRAPAVLALGALLAMSAATLRAEVRSDFDHMADFSDFHTYSWGKVDANRPFFAQRIRYKVDQDLQKHGWQLVPTGGDVTVFAKGNVRDEREMETFYNGFGGGWGGGWGWGGWGWGGWGPGGFGNAVTQPVQIEVSHTVIDIFNNSNHQILFRGIADDELSDNSDRNTDALFRNIDKMFKHFPPKQKH